MDFNNYFCQLLAVNDDKVNYEQQPVVGPIGIIVEFQESRKKDDQSVNGMVGIIFTDLVNFSKDVKNYSAK